MKALIISQHFWPEEFLINNVATSLQETGVEVTVLTGQPNYPSGKILPPYKWWNISRESHPEGFEVCRVPLVPRGRASGIQLVINYLSFMLFSSLIGPWQLRNTKFDVIFVYGTSPIFQALGGIVLKYLKKAPLIIWVQDLWPESLEITGFVRNKTILAFVGFFVTRIYKRADLLLVQSRAFVDSVRAKSCGTPVAYHPNPGEPESAAPAPGGYGLKPGFNIVFAGNLGKAQALETILEAAVILRRHDDIRFVLVGSGSQLEWLRAKVAERGVNIELPGRFERREMGGILRQASALLVSLAKNPAVEKTVPSKVQAYLAAGRAVIASLDGEGGRVIEQARAGIVCPAEDADALARGVLDLYKLSGEERSRLGQNGREFYLKNFEPGKLAQDLKQFFAKAIRAGDNPRGQ